MGTIFKNLISVPEPSQARSKAALDRFLEAGEKLLAENRFEEAGVAVIAQEARSSVGSFYRLLTDKETLLLLLLHRFLNQVDDVIEETLEPTQWQDKTVTDIADTFIKALADLYKDHAGALRAVILRSSKDKAFRSKVHEFNSFISTKMEKLLRQHKSVLNHPKPERAIKSIAHIILGILNQHTLTGNLDGLSQKTLVDEIRRIFLTYLGVEETGG